MTYNLFIAYDLEQPGQNYRYLQRLIQSLGKSHQFQRSVYYVTTVKPPKEVIDLLSVALDENDRLLVIDARSGYVSKEDPYVLDAINSDWNPPASSSRMPGRIRP